MVWLRKVVKHSTYYESDNNWDRSSWKSSQICDGANTTGHIKKKNLRCCLLYYKSYKLNCLTSTPPPWRPRTRPWRHIPLLPAMSCPDSDRHDNDRGWSWLIVVCLNTRWVAPRRPWGNGGCHGWKVCLTLSVLVFYVLFYVDALPLSQKIGQEVCIIKWYFFLVLTAQPCCISCRLMFLRLRAGLEAVCRLWHGTMAAAMVHHLFLLPCEETSKFLRTLFTAVKKRRIFNAQRTRRERHCLGVETRTWFWTWK